MIKLEENFLTKLKYNNRISINIIIGERKELSAIQLNKVRQLYEDLLIFNEIIINKILPEIKDDIIGNIELEGDLGAYLGRFPCYNISCDFKDGDKGYYHKTHESLVKQNGKNNLNKTIENNFKLYRLIGYYIVDGYFVEKECNWREHEKEEMIFMNW